MSVQKNWLKIYPEYSKDNTAEILRPNAILHATAFFFPAALTIGIVFPFAYLKPAFHCAVQDIRGIPDLNHDRTTNNF